MFGIFRRISDCLAFHRELKRIQNDPELQENFSWTRAIEDPEGKYLSREEKREREARRELLRREVVHGRRPPDA
jgi:hypothetical protein